MLQNEKIIFSTQYSFQDLKSENNIVLKFDFAIFNSEHKLKCLIEFDGEQHFYDAPHKGFYTKEVIEKIIERDNRKNKYCKDKNILLYRIPYYYSDE